MLRRILRHSQFKSRFQARQSRWQKLIRTRSTSSCHPIRLLSTSTKPDDDEADMKNTTDIHQVAELKDPRVYLPKIDDSIPFSQRVFATLNLKTFSEEELRTAFLEADLNKDNVIDKEELFTLVKRVRGGVCDKECKQFVDHLWSYEMHGAATDAKGITEAQFKSRVKDLAQELDTRVWPIAAMFASCGLSVGIIVPCLPIFAQSLGISMSQYGMIIGLFAGAKALSNIPAAVLIDKLGRKRSTVISIALIGASVGGLALTSSYQELLGTRVLLGVGVSGFTTAATLMISDLSTPLNRARTLAPPMMAFSTGMALGPALGGVLADTLGLSSTFGVVGCAFGSIALGTQLFFKDIPPVGDWPPLLSTPPPPSSSSSSSAPSSPPPTSPTELSTFAQWKLVASDSCVLKMLLLNATYLFVYAGSQITLLPLLLVDGFQMPVSNIGAVYAGMSVIGILVTPYMARAIDKYGTVMTVLPSCMIISGAMALVPYAHQLAGVVGAVAAWTVAGTALNTAPTAYVTDAVDPSLRSQALALLRTVGDFGMLSGSVVGGMLADWSSIPDAMQINGMILCAVTGMIASTRILSRTNKIL